MTQNCVASSKVVCSGKRPWVLRSVSNPVYTDTGIPVFGTPNTDTGKNLPVLAGIENV
jgi:hypothetical protein